MRTGWEEKDRTAAVPVPKQVSVDDSDTRTYNRESDHMMYLLFQDSAICSFV